MILLSLVACNEDMRAHYATAADAVKDGAFERGWLPDVLRPDATNIQEFHDLDTNHGGATFRYTDQLVQRVEHECAQVPANEVIRSPFTSWPEFLRKGDTSAQLAYRSINTYKCGIFITAVDSSNQIGYFWH